jgi:hypothetical protein
MARLNTAQITIKISKLQKDDEDDETIINADTVKHLESIITELVGLDGIIVEIDSFLNE